MCGGGGLIHGEYFIVDNYMLNSTHTQANMKIATVPLPTVAQLSQRISLLHSADRSDRMFTQLDHHS